MDSMPAEELQNTQFDNYSPKWKDKIWGIFGEQDTLAHYEPLFLQYYTHTHHFPGGSYKPLMP